MKRIVLSVTLATLFLSMPEPSRAWDDIGHQVVARIAWDTMPQATRDAAVALLKKAPADSDLTDLLGSGPDRDRDFFVEASTWPDIVRDTSFPQRRQKYHRQPSHYINYFWEPSANEIPRDRPDLRPQSENVVERLAAYEDSLANASGTESERAIELAWVLHLVGDIHQPLHTSARVTSTERTGDQGGNLFRLNGSNTLHGYWDGILRSTFVRRSDSDTRFVERIAQYIEARFPQSALSRRMEPREFEVWAQEGLLASKTAVYPSDLSRNVAPSPCYRQRAFLVAEPALALAGYRLAEMLEEVLAP